MGDFWAAVGVDKNLKREAEQRDKLLRAVIKKFTVVQTTEPDSGEQRFAANDVCSILEDILLHGLQGKSGKEYGTGTSTSIWDFIQHGIKHSGSQQLRNTIRQVEKLQNVQTSDGRGRAWIRIIFSEELLISAFSALVSAKNLRENWYAPFAFMASIENTTTFLTALDSLEGFKLCQLNADDDNLDCARVYTSEIDETPKRRKRKKKSKNLAAHLNTNCVNDNNQIEIDGGASSVLEIEYEVDKCENGKSSESQMELSATLLSVDVEDEIDMENEITGIQQLTEEKHAEMRESAPGASHLDRLIFDDLDIQSGPEELEFEEVEGQAGEGEEISLQVLPDSTGISFTEDEPEEFEDKEIAKALRALDQTSYVDEEEFSNLTISASSVHTGRTKDSKIIEKYGPFFIVPGDRRDFFSLTVGADKTPLAAQKWENDKIHVVAPLLGTHEDPITSKSTQRSRSTSFNESLKFTRTEEGELAVDLRRPSKPEIRGPPGWEGQQRLLFLQIHKKKTPENQLNLCAGCASLLKFGIFSKVRYCEYSGKYFCSSCHDNEAFFIPARIVQQWDLSQHAVSKFSFRLLEEIYNDPLFDISTINPNIYRTSAAMKKIKALRQQIFYMKDFLLTCNKHYIHFWDLAGSRRYLLTEKHVYSLKDFVEIAQGKMQMFLQGIAEKLIVHIKGCDLCLAKGFICEFCDNQKPVYPFQLKTVVQCPDCKAFFHRACYKKDSCPKCLRIKSLHKI